MVNAAKMKVKRKRNMTFASDEDDELQLVKAKLLRTQNELQDMKELYLAQALEMARRDRVQQKDSDADDETEDEIELASESSESEDIMPPKKQQRKKRENPTRYHAWPMWLRLVQGTGCTRKKGFMKVVKQTYDTDLAEVVHEKVMSEILKYLLKKNKITGSVCHPIEALQKLGVEFLASPMGFDDASTLSVDELLKQLVQHKALIKSHVEEFPNWEALRQTVYKIDGARHALEQATTMVNAV